MNRQPASVGLFYWLLIAILLVPLLRRHRGQLLLGLVKVCHASAAALGRVAIAAEDSYREAVTP